MATTNCTPGGIEQISYTTDEMNKAIEQTALNFGQITNHEQRIAANENDIIDLKGSEAGIPALESRIGVNEVDIASLESDVGTNTPAIASNTTELADHELRITNAESTLTTNSGLLVELRTDVNKNTNDIAAFPGVYALVGGSATQVFEVADSISLTSAMSVGFADGRYALLSGSALQAFEVADPIGNSSAISKGWLIANYPTSIDIQTMIDTSIATHKADASAHHVKT